jgi:hypothetical protein
MIAEIYHITIMVGVPQYLHMERIAELMLGRVIT